MAPMKGFPNQVTDLSKLAKGMQCLLRLLEQGRNGKDDGIFGQALVQAGVAGTGHTPMPVEQYIRQQLTKRPSDQSFRTTARGLRELYRLFRLIDDTGPQVEVTDLGRRAANFAGLSLNAEQLDFWRSLVRNIIHDGGDAQTSHPYQVLLRLVGRKPGITRAKCALALEAKNDSPRELGRIIRLVDLPDDRILRQLRVTKSNWDNAKKVLPSLAEQLGDVIVTLRGRDKTYRLADAPGRADAGPAAAPGVVARPGRDRSAPLTPRTSRQVTPETIGRAGTAERRDPEFQLPADLDPAA
ncbi:MAG: hypothetical protein HYU47_10440, partial [Deltaproteobacteria bacterium]|nr:hypothetical protein [Deltaproteobacteria bacterium]